MLKSNPKQVYCYRSKKSLNELKKPLVMNRTLSIKRNTQWWSRQSLHFCTYQDCPRYLQDNEFIITGYRKEYSYRESWISLFHWHNETINVWLHLVGFLIHLYLIWHSWFAPIHPAIEFADRIVLILFLSCVSYTLLMSAMYHLHCCVSKEDCVFWGCLDFSGISASIAGSSFSIMYFLIHCDNSSREIWIGILMIVNMVGIVGPTFPFWMSSDFRVYRTGLFIMSSVLSFIPTLNYVFHHGAKHIPHYNENITFVSLGLVIPQFLLGSIAYAFRIPERFFPGKFDIFFHSHQIWHFLVVTGSVCLYYGLVGLIKWRLDDPVMCELHRL
ncbi:hemolysin-III related-domain-containing protein [Globomyces pollinis-pini]|nr:hemolysin-III related-domain-containing protein [Globomyces pollinis-pini]